MPFNKLSNIRWKSLEVSYVPPTNTPNSTLQVDVTATFNNDNIPPTMLNGDSESLEGDKVTNHIMSEREDRQQVVHDNETTDTTTKNKLTTVHNVKHNHPSNKQTSKATKRGAHATSSDLELELVAGKPLINNLLTIRILGSWHTGYFYN